jgi:hypothetical protein
LEVREQCQVNISNRFADLENLDDKMVVMTMMMIRILIGFGKLLERI